MIYKIKIKLFFNVIKNKFNNIIEGTEYDLFEEYYNINNKDKIKIKLKGINKNINIYYI